jgi:hypothetical protein
MKRWPIRWKHVLIVVGLVVLIAMVMDFNQRLDELNRLSGQLATVRAEGTTVMQTQAALVTQVAYAGSTAAVEHWAYVDGHWVRTGEIPIEVLPAGNVTPTPAQPPVAQTPEPQNWQVWWELFFGN